MSAETRPQDMLDNSRGIYAFEDELLRPDLKEVMSISGVVLPSIMQTEDYTRSIFDILGQDGLIYKPERNAKEPQLRSERNRLLSEDRDVRRTILMSSAALGRIIGSREITAGSVRKGMGLVERTISGELPHVEVAIYMPGSPDELDASDLAETHSQTWSGENGRRVWIHDSAVIAPIDSAPAHVLPRVAEILLSRESTLRGVEALALMEEALSDLKQA